MSRQSGGGMKVEYFFISYAWRRFGESEYAFDNAVTGEHPLKWQVRVKKAHEDYYFRLISYQKISDEEYVRFKDTIG